MVMDTMATATTVTAKMVMEMDLPMAMETAMVLESPTVTVLIQTGKMAMVLLTVEMVGLTE